jgi:anaerobic ribonucleoside-triphosphate reductase activating protein
LEIRIGGTVSESIVDGPGIRFVVFCQGCLHDCPGCHNPESHDLNGGTPVDVEELWMQISKGKLLQGVTFSGGEPFLQAEPLVDLAQKVKAEGLDLVVYTGYLFEELRALSEQKPEIYQLLELTDILIDGPYLANQRDLNLPYRGSRNQRIIMVQDSLAQAKLILKAV